MKKLMVVAVFAMIAIMVVGMLGSGAWFTDQATNQTATITSGTLSIDNDKVTSVSLGAIDDMVPGEKTGDIQIVILNDGTEDLGWAGNLIFSNSVLKDVIYIDLAQMEFRSPDGQQDWEPVDKFIENGIGSGTWPTTWGGPDNLATLSAFDGNNSMIPGSGYEFMGALKPGYQYRLTLRFGFYEGAGNAYQDKGPLDISFQVKATQLNLKAMTSFISPAFLQDHLNWMNQQIAKQHP